MKTEKKQYQKYSFVGSVLKFGSLVCDDWKAETFAPSKAKALSNFKYRFKRENDLVPSVNIELVGSVSKE